MYVRRLLAACLLFGTLLLVLSFATGDASAADGDDDGIEVPYAQDKANDKWTVLVYMDGDNNLEEYGIGDFIEMASVGSSSDVNLLVQMDRVSGESSLYGDWTDCLRFCVNSSETPTQGNSVVDLGEVNMGSSSTLSDFIIWGMTYYPADHYVLILWDHGGGWEGVCQDSSSSNNLLTMSELNIAMEMVNESFVGFKIDVIGYDACLMGETEVYYEIEDYADYFVGSEINIPANGWDYETSLARLVANPDMNSSMLASYITGDYIDFYSGEYASDVTMSVVNCSRFDDLATSVDALADEMYGQMSTQHNYYNYCRSNSGAFSDDTLLDLLDFAYKMSQYGPTATIRALAQEVYDRTVECITFNAVNDESGGEDLTKANGLTIYFDGSSLSDYRSEGLQFVSHYSWDEMLVSYYSAISASNNVVSISSFSPVSSYSTTVGTEVDLSVTASDADGDTITYYWYVDDVLQTSSTSAFTLDTSSGSNGDVVEVTCQVWDGLSWDEQTWTITLATSADLFITDYYLMDSCGDEVTDVTSGHPTYLYVTVANTGGTTASSFTINMYLDGTLYCYWSSATLAGGATFLLKSTAFSYSEIAGHNITVVLDTADVVDETDETNNEGYWEFDVVKAKYTILVYMDGDNNLEKYQINNFLEMASVGSNAEVTIIVQLDRISNAEMSAAGISSDYYDIRYGDWNGTLRFYITEGMTPTVANAVQDMGEVDMGDDAVLEDFLLWGVDNYQADDYIVILKDHGTAWYGLCSDYTSSSILSLDEMSYALHSMVNETGAPIDIVVLDDCLMGTIEVAAQLNDLALYAVVSETIGWTSNLDYADLLTYVQGNLDDTTEEKAIAIANMENLVDSSSYTTQCVAAYDLTLTDSLLTAFEAYLDDLYACWLDDPSGITEARFECDGFDVAYMYVNDTIDLYQFVQLTMEHCGNATLNTTAQALLDMLDPSSATSCILVVRTTTSASFCNGMSIYFPQNSSTYLSIYDTRCDFVDDSGWNEFLDVFLNDSPPQTTMSVSGTSGSNGWYISSVLISFSVYDTTSLDYEYLNYSINGGAWTGYSGAFTISTDDTYVITFFATGANGAVEEVKSVTVKIDKTAPTVSANVSGMTVTLSANDVTSGVSTIYYRVDGGAWQTYSSALTFTANGWKRTIQYYAVDNASVVSSTKSVTVGQNDAEAPETTADVDGTSGNDGWYTTAVSVTLSAEDDGGSGLGAIYYKIDDGNWTAYSGTLLLNYTGTYVLKYYAEDNYGNEEDESTLTIKVDVSAPTASAIIAGSGDECYNGTVTITFEGGDDGSGISEMQYRIDGGAWTNAVSIDLAEEGTFLLDLRAVDIAGNIGAISNWTVTIDLTAPTSSIELEGAEGGLSNGTVTVVITGDDGGPADLYLQYSVNGSDWTLYSVPITFDEDGTYEVVCRAVDSAGNIGGMMNTTFVIDTIAPTSIIDAEGVMYGGSYVNSVKMSITATDGGSSVASTFYKLDDGPWTEMDGSVNVTTVGDHSLSYYSVDALGNEEDVRTFDLSIMSATVPGEVTGLTLTDEMDDHSWVNVSWTEPSDGGLEILYYLIYRAEAGSNDYELMANVTGTWYHDENVSEGVTMDYYVVAVNELGLGNASAVTEVTTDGSEGSLLGTSWVWIVIICAAVSLVIVAAIMVVKRRK